MRCDFLKNKTKRTNLQPEYSVQYETSKQTGFGRRKDRVIILANFNPDPNPRHWPTTVTFNSQRVELSHTLAEIKVNSQLIQKIEKKQTDGRTRAVD